MRAIRLLGILLTFLCTELPAQEFLRYQINWGEDSIGIIEAQKVTKDTGDVHYIINSSSSFRVVFKFHLTYDYFCSFRGDSLIKASAIRKMNGKEKERSWTTLEKKGYQIYVDGEEVNNNDPIIPYSISVMYFQEPKSYFREVFSERFGRNVPMSKEGPKSYKLSLPNGYSSTYNYDSNGVCESVDVETRWADLNFVRL
jgi:hypothetical protein